MEPLGVVMWLDGVSRNTNFTYYLIHALIHVLSLKHTRINTHANCADLPVTAMWKLDAVDFVLGEKNTGAKSKQCIERQTIPLLVFQIMTVLLCITNKLYVQHKMSTQGQLTSVFQSFQLHPMDSVDGVCSVVMSTTRLDNLWNNWANSIYWGSPWDTAESFWVKRK